MEKYTNEICECGLELRTRLYYNFYKERVCAKSKEMLTKAVKSMVKDVKSLVAQSRNSFRSLSDCTFDSFGPFASNLSKQHTIRLVSMKSVDLRLGVDTKLKLRTIMTPPANTPRKRKTPPAASRQSTSVRAPTATLDDDGAWSHHRSGPKRGRQGITDSTSSATAARSHVLFDQPSATARERELTREIAQLKDKIAYNERAHQSQLALSYRGAKAKYKEEVARKDATIQQLEDELRNRSVVKTEQAAVASPSRPPDTPSKKKLRLVISDLRLENDALNTEIAALKQIIQSKDKVISQRRSRIDQFLLAEDDDKQDKLDSDDGDSDDSDDVDVQRDNV